MTSYVLAAIGMPVFLATRGERRPVHLIAAALVVGAIGYIVYKSVYPAPAFPFNILPYLYAAILAMGLVWFLVLRLRHPDRARQVGTYDEETPPPVRA